MSLEQGLGLTDSHEGVRAVGPEASLQGSNDGFLSCRSFLFFKKNIVDVCPDANMPWEGGAVVDKRCCCRCGIVLLCSDKPVLSGVAWCFLRRFVDSASQSGYVIEEPY